MSAILVLLAAAQAAPPAVKPIVGDLIFHYVRSNRDGSEPEHVVQFRPTRTGISVYKWVSKCTTSAYVTAEMDEGVGEGRRFVAGKVAPDGTQAQFGTLTLDPDNAALLVDITPPGGSRIQQAHKLKGRPFIIYDFDFADLNAFLQEHREEVHFSFNLPVVWPSDAGLFRDLGTLHANYDGEEVRDGRKVRMFFLGVEGPTTGMGKMWVDAAQGYIVEAELNLPNHLEYRDFRLKLEKVEHGGRAAWDALTKSQYADCPTGN
ncbi:MAG TPA: hypothetical protein VFZ35_02910 [Sphingomicrobium sp.]